MAGQTIAEKIFSRHAGRPVWAGETVIAAIDLAMATDGSGPLTLDLFAKMGGTRAFDPGKVVLVLDHYVPCPNDKVARLHDSLRAFCRAGNCTLYETGEGICHQLLPEQGRVKPGQLIVGGDSHSTSYGALSALGTGIGSSDLAAAIMTGQLWFRVPAAILVTLSGRLTPGVTAKDLALHLVGTLGADGAIYKSIEFAGDGLATLSVSERLTICNMMVETGAKCALMPADDTLAAFFPGEAIDSVNPDPDALYGQQLIVDLTALQPQLALPHQPDNVVPLAAAVGTPAHMGVIGTCTNGRLDDLAAALAVMGDRDVAPGFELLIVPASRRIYRQAAEQGLLAAFAAKGATILPPGCGPCCGSSPGIPSDGENVISTANRNFLGRMGNTRAAIYLASPAAVAAAAVTGCITDPREVLR